ncbi:MAG: D-alanyl-D-alanine carboxypeptidase family protein [Magnetococcales bacterium]|nr:D-alanyl-D-alanine carboxypeptidase family protein [Magnetococcales bacterium]
MKRREFLKTVAAGALGSAAHLGFPDAALAARRGSSRSGGPYGAMLDDYLDKIRDFDRGHTGDIFLDRDIFPLLVSSVKRFKRVQGVVGHGNFYLLSFDEAVNVARRYPSVGEFTRQELDFLERIFYETAAPYGFFGEKPLKNLTDAIPRNKVTKIRGTGNYLYRGVPLETYKKIQRAVGRDVVLTSGIRSVTKQFLLFLEKAYLSNGNLSQASRSLAPPGYSFHGVGDFDVGQKGYGKLNFTREFVRTKVFKRLAETGYVRLRYPRDNMLGVRFEPWHVKVKFRAI